MVAEAHPLVLNGERSPQYKKWIDGLCQRYREALPFYGPAHMVMTLGSGLAPSLDALHLKNTVVTPFSEIGLPEGSNAAHPKKVVAGFADDGKPVVAFTGRTALFEVPEEGVETEFGHITQTEAAMAYLDVVSNVGTENLIITTAAGGINHPMFPFQRPPFSKKDLPVIGVVGADIMSGHYPFEHMGHHQGQHGSFFALQDGNEQLNQAFIASMQEVNPHIKVPTFYYASIPAVFEDRGLAHFLAINGIQALGMTYGAEKTHLSGIKGIGRFMAITVITDDVELYDPKHPNRWIPISVLELRHRRPWEFMIRNPADDEQVRVTAALANNRLGGALNLLEQRI